MFAVIWDGVDAEAPGEGKGWKDVKDPVALCDYSALSGWSDVAATEVPRTVRSPQFGPDFTAALRTVANHHTAGRQLTHLTILVHGFDFDPVSSSSKFMKTVPQEKQDPRSGIFDLPNKDPALGESWLPIFGVTNQQQADAAPLLCFCWRSSGAYGLASFTNFYQHAVFDLAPQAAKSLAATIAVLNAAGITLDIVAHSLGTRVVMKALATLPECVRATAVRRIVLMNGAEFSIDALAAMRGVNADVFNLVSRRDKLVLELGAQQMMMPFRAPGRQAWVIGYNGMMALPGWIDIAMDPQVGLSETLASSVAAKQSAALATLGGFTLSTEGYKGRGPHWSTYRDPQNQAFVQALLTRPDWTAQHLRASGIVEGFIEENANAARYGDIVHITHPRIPFTDAERKLTGSKPWA